MVQATGGIYSEPRLFGIRSGTNRGKKRHKSCWEWRRASAVLTRSSTRDALSRGTRPSSEQRATTASSSSNDAASRTTKHLRRMLGKRDQQWGESGVLRVGFLVLQTQPRPQVGCHLNIVDSVSSHIGCAFEGVFVQGGDYGTHVLKQNYCGFSSDTCPVDKTDSAPISRLLLATALFVSYVVSVAVTY